MTRIFGILGFPVEHSLSPVMHTAAFEALGLDAIYAPFETPPRHVSQVLKGLEVAGIEGLNVTVPHKERVLRYLHPATLDVSARAVGAVNTLVRHEGRLAGYNTDVSGFARVLTEELRVDVRGKRVVLLGAGGAARAAAWSLARRRPATITIANRTASRARALCRWLRSFATGILLETVPWTGPALQGAVERADLLVNATSLGLRHGDPLPVAAAALHRRLTVIDLVYRAPTTPLVLAARRRGALAVDGLPMLVYQGAEAFRLWWHRPAPVDAMRRAVERAVRDR